MESKSGQKFCLQWKDFENKISAGFKELREEKDFFDVTLACDDSQLQAHKVILGACSPFFRTILKNNPHPQPLIYLKGVKYNELDAVLKFMYEGEVNVAQDDLNTFLAVAEDLHVKGLTQASQKEQPISPSKQANNVSPYNRPGAGYTMKDQETHHKKTPTTDYRMQHTTTPRTEYETQQKITPRKDSETPNKKFCQDYGHEGDVEYIDQYLPPSIKIESPVVDVESDSETPPEQPLVQHESAYHPVEQTGYQQFQQEYPKSSLVYQEPGGDTTQDFYSQHTTKATQGEYLCNICGKQARDMYGMKKHLEGKHEITPGYNCPICHLFCKTKSILLKHKKTYH